MCWRAPWRGIRRSDGPIPFTADIDTSFPKGQALADWLVNVGGKSPLGKISINAAQHTVDAANAMVAPRWIDSTTPTSVPYLTANTPINVPEEMQCGRVVLSDIHVSSGDTSTTSTQYPDGCRTTDLSDQEKALEFMLSTSPRASSTTEGRRSRPSSNRTRKPPHPTVPLA